MLLSNIIKKKFDAVLGRYESDPTQYYYSVADFPDIKIRPFNVCGNHGLLKGNFYYYDNADTDKLVIFDHGIGSGHLAYFKEIEYIARHGYTVYSYDHTGCMNSEGDGILGFAQGINDLDHIISEILRLDPFHNSSIKLIGHSWGGYSSMNVAQFHPEVTHVVSLAGFLSARALVEQYLPDFVMKYSDEVMNRERKINPKYADLDARESMKRSNAALLHLQSKDDVKVKFELCYPLLQSALKNRKNTNFIMVDNRGHDPQRTERAAMANKKMLNDLNALTKKKKLKTIEEQKRFRNSYDWKCITEQDKDIWKQIFDFLDS